MTGNPSIDLHALAPEIILSATILLVLVTDAFLPARRAWVGMPLATIGVLGALAATLTLLGSTRSTFDGSFVVDGFALLFKVLFLVLAVLVLLLSARYMRDGRYYQGEYYVLLLTAFLGCSMMPSSRNLLTLFLALELVSAPGFLLAAFRKTDPRSNEAGLKFFLIGVLSTAVMLYGMSLVYGLAGTLDLRGIGAAFGGPLDDGREALALASILFIVAGFAFKVSAVPFQFWAPDTYEGAPVPVAGFLATASKAAGFAGLLQVMFVAFPAQHAFWAPVFAALAIATMTIGNLVALQQRQVVRLLAYSGIGQAGYILLPFALASGNLALDGAAFSAAVTYILIYAVMTAGAFAVVTALAAESPGLLVEDLAGLGRRSPLIAVAMTTFMVALAGIPPTAGFWAKLFVFSAAIDRGGIGIALAIAMVLNSVVSLAYYLAVARTMMVSPPTTDRAFRPSLAVRVVALASLAAVLVVGVYPQALAHFPPLATLVG
ncbi:MAG: NADH-quinone oxidoreductase subunit N [Actinomycetota bacterium]